MIIFLENSNLRIKLLYDIIEQIDNIIYSISKGFQFNVEINNIHFLMTSLCEQRKIIIEFKQLTLFLLKIEEFHINMIKQRIEEINNYIGFGVLEQQNIQLEITNLNHLIKIPLRTLSITYQHNAELQIFLNTLEEKVLNIKENSNYVLEICKSFWSDNIELQCILQIVSNERFNNRIDIYIQFREQQILYEILYKILYNIT